MQSLFPFRYRQIWTVNKVKKLVVITWLICYTYSLLLILFFHLSYLTEKMFASYVCVALMTLDVTYFLFAVFTYSMMFRSLVKSRRRSTNQNVSLLNTFVNSRFFVSALIIGSFILFTILSDFLFCSNLYLLLVRYSATAGLTIYADVSLRVSSIVDGMIYIYLQKPVREMFLQRICCCSTGIAPNNNNTRYATTSSNLSVDGNKRQELSVNQIEMHNVYGSSTPLKHGAGPKNSW